MKKLCFLIAALFALTSIGFSQITVSPDLPTDQDGVEITFDALQGSGGLADYSGDMYAHTGVITNLSTGSSDWKHVKAGWSENIPACKLTPLGSNKWKLVIGPSIREYYSVPAAEEIQKLAFVFRSADGTKTGKTATGGDIFYAVLPSSLSVKINVPAENYIYTSLNSTIHVEVTSFQADTTFLFMDSQKLIQTTNASISYDINATQTGLHLIKALAKNLASEIKVDSFYCYVRPLNNIAEIPAGMRDGINYLSETSVLLSLYAPQKEAAYVIGDFNNWLVDDNYLMNRTPDGKRYWIQLDGLVPGKEYIFQYLVDNNIRIGDPYTAKVSDPWNDKYIDNATYPGLIPYPEGKTQGIASVFQTAQKPYEWSNNNFTPPAITDLVIYELLVRDFTEKHTFQAVIDTIGYLHKLGINAIELMPVNEFEGNLSWGYNPNYYFAVDKYYGPANQLKQLVDTCHRLGIAVLGDLVLNHSYNTSPFVMLYWDAANSRPAANSPWYNTTSPNTAYSWGNDFNHQSADTKKLVDSITSYWMNEFRFDGFRFDFTKGFTNTPGDGGAYDAARITILKRMATEMWKRNPDAYVIFEHLTDNSEEKELANFGIMLWGNMNGKYCEAAMGYNETGNSDLTWGAYTSRGWSQPHLISYMESHDEERQVYKCLAFGNALGNYSIKDTATALKRAALAATFFFTIPGPKMIWQFGEQGYDYSKYYPSGNESTKTDPKPIRWDYMSDPDRIELFENYASLIYLKKNFPLFSTNNFQLDVVGAIKKINLTLEDKSALVLGNFDVVNRYVTPGFSHTGKWYDYMSGDSLVVTDVNASIKFNPGEYRLYLSEKVENPYGIESVEKEPFAVIVAPNPVTESCSIFISCTGTDFCEVSDFNVLGSEIQTLFKGKISSQLQLPWTPERKGIHILKIRIGKLIVTRKVVVQ
jgi:glycosidase